MKALRLSVLALMLMFLGTPAGGQVEPVEPEPGSGSGGCVECTREGEFYAKCGSDPVGWGDGSKWVCIGGTRCYAVYGGWECEPNCGTRCHSI